MSKVAADFRYCFIILQTGRAVEVTGVNSTRREAASMKWSTVWVLSAATFCGAAPPVVTLPSEVPGEVAAFVVVQAKVDGAKAVKFLPLDAGLSVFPSGLLSDQTVTVVVAQRPGRYRVLAYAGNADGASEPVTTTVVIGGAVQPPPIDPPPVTGGKKFFLIVRAPGPIQPAFEKVLNLPAWKDLKNQGHLMKDVPANELPMNVKMPPVLPSLLAFSVAADGKSMSSVGDPQPVPQSDDAIRGLIK
jgi:hypothetical protein